MPLNIRNEAVNQLAKQLAVRKHLNRHSRRFLAKAKDTAIPRELNLGEIGDRCMTTLLGIHLGRFGNIELLSATPTIYRSAR
jgi:hypothetical protein